MAMRFGTSSEVRLRVGVVGLGRLWEARHRPALLASPRRFRVAAVYDQVARRAEVEARSLGCRASQGVAALVGGADVDVVYVVSPQWFGLHPLSVAAGLGKPAYTALPLAAEPALIDRLAAATTPIVPEFARRAYPATIRLVDLLRTTLGPARRVSGQVWLSSFDRRGEPGPDRQIAPAPLLVDPGSYLIDWSRLVFGAEPVAIRRVEGTGPDAVSFALDFAGGGLAEWTIGRESPETPRRAAIEVVAERGSATVAMPDRLSWSGPGGSGDERLPLSRPIGEMLADDFYNAALGLSPTAPTWADAVATARLVDRLRGEAGR